MPVALKDLVSVTGRSVHGRRPHPRGISAPYDAHITERLEPSGAVILGKTNMDEFAMGSSTEHRRRARPPTRGTSTACRAGRAAAPRRRSPRSTRRVSIGTDTGGSIRQPAALTGIVGLEPTYGRVSRYGIVAFASSLDQIGPFARDVRDAAALLHAVAGRDERDSTSSPEPVPDVAAAGCRSTTTRPLRSLRGKRLGLPREYFVAGMEPGVEARVREAVAALEAAGADDRGGGAAAHRVRPRHVLHRRARRGVGEPRPLRRHPLRAAARRGPGRAGGLPRDARHAGSGRR